MPIRDVDDSVLEWRGRVSVMGVPAGDDGGFERARASGASRSPRLRVIIHGCDLNALFIHHSSLSRRDIREYPHHEYAIRTSHF